MSALVLDAGAFVAVERADRAMVARLRAAERSGLELRTNGAVVAQVWRGPSGRQAVLAGLLRSIDVRPVDLRLGQEAGLLLGRAGRGDAVDATWSPWLLQGTASLLETWATSEPSSPSPVAQYSWSPADRFLSSINASPGVTQRDSIAA